MKTLHHHTSNPLRRHRRCRHIAAACRGGLTLLEVLLAVSVFLGAMTALSQLITTGSRAAVQAQLRTEAILRCETKLSEVLAGVDGMQSTSDAPFPDDPKHWKWSLQVLGGPHADLIELQVTVTHLAESGASNVSYSLNRYVRDPQLFLDAAAAAAESETTEVEE